MRLKDFPPAYSSIEDRRPKPTVERSGKTDRLDRQVPTSELKGYREDNPMGALIEAISQQSAEAALKKMGNTHKRPSKKKQD